MVIFPELSKSKILLVFIAIFNSLDDKEPETDFLMALLLSGVYCFTSFDRVPKHTSDFTCWFEPVAATL